ncbi:MAG TPA: VOC family protein [Rhodoblastus sp.]|nr:VOC family protein [Rhodoblastus sp.]
MGEKPASSFSPRAPALRGVLETSLYVENLARAADFWEGVMSLKRLAPGDGRFVAYDAGDRTVLLLFARGATLETAHMPGGTIPPHDGAGRLHLAFAVAAAELPDWEARLAQAGVPVEGRATWPRGGESIYFRDPDGHLVELATPGLWPTY